MCSMHRHKHHFSHWFKHMASVPKGFLRYHVLKLLNEKPRSGSEIMKEIEERTEGHWKPSPGSIYPLLAWLQDKGYTRELPIKESGIKQYSLTDEGKAFLEEHIKKRDELRKKFGFFRPPFHGFQWLNHYPKKTKELFESGKKFVTASWKLLDQLREQQSEEVIREAKEIIEKAAKGLNAIAERLEKSE